MGNQGEKLTGWPSLVQVIVGEGIPNASQPRVRGCFKVTVRFSGWPSSWISGGTEEVKKKKGRFVFTLCFSPVWGVLLEGRIISRTEFSPFTFSLVFLSTEPASLVATHLKSPLWLADDVLIMRAPSLATENSDCSGCISRPFLNQRTLGWGEPAGVGTRKALSVESELYWSRLTERKVTSISLPLYRRTEWASSPD